MSAASRDHDVVSGALSIRMQAATGGVTAFELGGELDSRNSAALEQALHDAIDRGASRLVLDLSRLTFCDSSGLEAIVASYHRLTMAGGRLAIVCADPRILRIFHVTRLDRLLAVAATRREALDLLTPEAPRPRWVRAQRRAARGPSASFG